MTRKKAAGRRNLYAPTRQGGDILYRGAVRVASDCPVLAVTGSGVSQLRDSRPAQRYCEPASGKAPP